MLAFAPVAFIRPTETADAADEADVLVGLWEASIVGSTTYRYIYAISRGSYIATGSVDEGFMGFRYSPTMGAYVRRADGSYKYRERGYVFDMKGSNVGTFTSVGTFELHADHQTFHGPGIFTQFDRQSKPVATEHLLVNAKRVQV